MLRDLGIRGDIINPTDTQVRPGVRRRGRSSPLSVAVYVEPTYHARTRDQRLPDAGMDRLAWPGDVLRQVDID